MVCAGLKRPQQMRLTVEANDGNSMFHAAYQRVEDRVQLLVIDE